jgi:hypothetical protein
LAVANLQLVEIPCGQGGLNYSKSVGDFPIQDLRYCENLTFQDDTWQKEGGCTKINTTVITDAPTITGLHDFWSDSSTQVRIAGTSDGKIVSFSTGGIVNTLASGLGTDRMTVFVEAYGTSSTRKLFAFNGYDTPQVTSDGITATGIDTPPADWTGTDQPEAGVMHNSRLWAWMGHRVYFSTLGDHEDFTDTGSGSINVYPGEGEKIVAGFSFAGRLFLWKYPTGIYWIDDSSTTVTDWYAKRLTRAVGMAGPLGRNQIENDVLFVASSGFVHSLATTEELGDAKASALFPEKIGAFVRENLNIDDINKAIAVYYPTKREWHLACTGAGYSYNNQRIVVDLHDMTNPRYRFSPRDVCESMALTRDSNNIARPMVGDNAGFIRILDDSTRNKDGAGYLAKFETADIELFPKGTRRGNLQFLSVIYRPTGDYDLTLDIYCDGAYTQSVSVNMGSGTGGQLDSFTLGTDVLGGGNVLNVRKRIAGDARRVKVIGYNSGANENFSVASLLLGYTSGNDRLV